MYVHSSMNIPIYKYVYKYYYKNNGRKRCLCLYVFEVIYLIQYTATTVIKSENCKILIETRKEAVPTPMHILQFHSLVA